MATVSPGICRPQAEPLEERLLMASFAVMGKDFLATGNQWQWKTVMTSYNGKATNVTGTWAETVTGSKAVYGRTAKVVHVVINGDDATATDSYQYMSSKNRVTVGAYNPIAPTTYSVRNNNPVELAPRVIYSTDRNREYGYGEMKVRVGGSSYNETHRYVLTYLGRETLTQTVNGSKRSFACVKVKVVHTHTDTQTNDVLKSVLTEWIKPNVGLIKSSQKVYRNGKAHSTHRTTLSAYTVR